ncbi:MAG: hypothetical protein ACYC63_15590 [Armatimonadota bacterium]
MFAVSCLYRILTCLALLCLVTGALAAEAADQARLEALRQAISELGQPETPPTAAAVVCWSPHSDFSNAGVAEQAPYGARQLVARYSHAAVPQDVPLQALWARDGQPLSTGSCVMKPGQDYVTDGVQRREGPLLPGLYQVRFCQGQVDLASGQITILAPEPLGTRSSKAVLDAGLTALRTALQAIDRGQAQPAATAAREALPLLATAVWTDPANQDAAAALELADAVAAIGRMDLAAGRQLPGQTLDWARRALAHSNKARALAVDALLKQLAAKMAETLGAAMPKLREATASG